MVSGHQPNKLYQDYQVYTNQAQPLEIRAFTVGPDYSFAIETFDEIRVSSQSPVIHLN